MISNFVVQETVAMASRYEQLGYKGHWQSFLLQICRNTVLKLVL
jgi:hypothetical protein